MQTPPTSPPSELGAATLFSVDAERDFPWGPGENDNYGNVCIKCKCCFRGHKRAMRCRKCHEEAQARWNAMTLEEQQAHHAANMEAAARYFEENVKTVATEGVTESPTEAAQPSSQK